MSKRILFISTPIGPLGSGHGGGVESTAINLLPILAKRGFKVGLIAPGPIITNVPFAKTIEVMGEPAVSALSAGRNSEVIVNPKGVLEKMWYTASCLQEDYDLVVSLSYDWLSFYLTPFFKIPVMHFITISSHIQAVDKMIEIVYKAYPRNFGLHTKAQAKTFGFFKEDICLLPSAVNLNIFEFTQKAVSL
jgi:UDP-glucose:tetrahydrobiopterin glucosyltransferase